MSLDLASSIPTDGHWIDGRSIAGASGQTFASRNPEDDHEIATLNRGTQQDIDRAVQSAHSAFQQYADTTTVERERWLLRAAELIETDQDAWIELLVAEIGSPLLKAKKEITTACGILRAAAGAVRQVCGRTYPSDVAGRLSLSTRRPLGVVAGMTPFNVPLIKNVKHSAMPLATGNPVVLLPSEHAPLVAMRLAKLYTEAGFPAGTFNVVTGFGKEIGDALTTHALVRCVGFTGSPRVGRHVAMLCGTQNRRYFLELGGKNPLVIMDDADLANAVRAAVFGSFLFQGQICMASSRIYVHKAVYDRVLQQLVAAAGGLSMGDLHDARTMIGPIISPRQRERIEAHVHDAQQRGATVHCGGQWQGNRYQPTVISQLPDDAAMTDEETFGPVTVVHRVESYEQALAAANGTQYGLSAAIYTADLDRAMDFAQRSTAGMVHVNAATVQDEPHVPFGGNGESGFGRESTDPVIDNFTQWKWITIQ